MTSMYTKSFDDADEVKAPPKAHVSVVKLGDMNASKMILNLAGSGQSVSSQPLAATAVRLAM